MPSSRSSSRNSSIVTKNKHADLFSKQKQRMQTEAFNDVDVVNSNIINSKLKKSYEKKLAEKYFKLWRIFVVHEKRRKELLKRDELLSEKVSLLINNLKESKKNVSSAKVDALTGIFSIFDSRNEKKASNCSINSKDFKAPMDVNTYRFQLQKEVITQKSIADKQNKIITELKIETQNIDATVAQTRFLSIRQKPKKEKKPVEPKPVPKVVQRIMQREEERKQRWELMHLRKVEREKKIKEQLEQARIQEKQEQRRKIQEEKRRKIEEEKERERLKKELEEERVRERERQAHLMEVAKEHDRKRLKRKTFYTWLEHVGYLRALESKYKHYFSIRFLERILTSWKYHCSLVKEKKLESAIEHNRKRLIIKYGRKWIMLHQQIRKKEAALQECCNRILLRQVIQKWSGNATKSSVQRLEDMEKAKAFYRRKLLQTAFRKWKQLPTINFERREREKRLRDWRSKVRLILPDYNIEETDALDP